MKSVNYFESSFYSTDNLKLFLQGWKPDQKPKAVLCLVHGLGEHSGRYEHWGVKFAQSGYVFVGFDLKGHGRSEGKRGHIQTFNQLFSDMKGFISELKKMFPELPLIIYGHSMGGNIALNYILNYPDDFKAGIISSPWIKLTKNPSQVIISIIKVLSLIYPSMIQKTGLNAAYISKDKEEVKKYSENIYNHDKISVSTFTEIHNSSEWIMKNVGSLKIPVILTHGDADMIVSHKPSLEFAQKAGPIVRLKIFEGLYHETHNEPEKEEVFSHLISEIENLD